YTDEHIAWLEEAHAALEVRSGDTSEELAARHAEFHRLLYAPAASEWDWRLFEILWQAGERYMFLILGSSMRVGDTDFRDAHTALLDAARARSVRLARRATADHLAGGVRLVGAALQPTERDDR